MIPHLNQLKESIWLRVVLASLVSSVVAILIYSVALVYLEVDAIMAGLLTLSLTILFAVVIGRLVALYSMKVIDYFARALLISTGKGEDIIKPTKDELPAASNEFIARITDQIMSISSQSKVADTKNEEELSFFKVISNNVSIPLIVADKDHKITFANEAAIKYLELKPNEVIGKYFYDAANLSFVGENTLEAWLKECRLGAVVENEVWERVRLNLPENKRKQFDLSAHYRKDDSTEVELILTFFDRTIIYERDDHDLSYIALAVHELRTPLTIMRGYIEVFEDELSQNLNSEQVSFMHNMSASAQQLSAFVSTILNVARVEENALVLNLKEEKWPELLNQVCKDMMLRAQVQNKKITIEADENMPTVGVDKVSIYEVMNNILDNAIKYTHTDETIVIKATKKGDMVETTITDKGVGIPENLMGHLFEKFYRAHSSKNSVSGTGLGLYLCRAIIQAHGGQIWVKSKEGQGSTFGFTLPLFSNVADQVDKDDNSGIERSAHGWIKNHSLYRG